MVLYNETDNSFCLIKLHTFILHVQIILMVIDKDSCQVFWTLEENLMYKVFPCDITQKELEQLENMEAASSVCKE